MRFINEKGGLKAIVVSHPHYYGTYVEWARVFGCEVLVSGEDGGWLCRMPPPAEEGGMGRGGLRFLEGEVGSGEDGGWLCREPPAKEDMGRGGLRFLEGKVGSGEDGGWLCREPPAKEDMGRGGLRFLEGKVGSGEVVLEGVTAIKTGGHFRGSLVLHWEGRLFIADTIVTVPVSWNLLIDSFCHPLALFCHVHGKGLGLIEASLF